MLFASIKNILRSLIKNDKTYDYYHQNTFWNDHYLIREYLNKQATGNSSTSWMKHLYETYFYKKNNLKMLSVVCGNGWQDRSLDKIFNFQRIDGFDISNELLYEARKNAKNSKFHYHQGNLNNIKINLNNYDLAVNIAGLHHVEKKEHMVWQTTAW